MTQALNEIAESLGVPQSTLRLYRDEFDEYLPVAGQGRRRRYPPEAVALLRQIIAQKQEGWTAAAIREELARAAQAGPRARRRTAETQLDEVVALLKAQAAEIALLRVEVAQLRGDVARFAAPARTDSPTLEAMQRERLRAEG